MIAASAHESIHRILLVLRLSSKWRNGFLRTMTRGVAFVSVGVGKCQSEDSFVCFGKKTHRKGLRTSFLTRLEEDKGEKAPKSSEGSSIEQSAEQKSAVYRREQSRKPTASMCGPRGRVGQREKMSQRSLWLCGNFARIHAPDSSQNARKVSQTSLFLRLVLTQVRVCSLSSTLLVVYIVFCVSVKKYEIPLAGDKRNHKTIWWPRVV